jgi:1-acyl-sn-glycerol-3-phosphate acyltransferase
MLAVSQEHPEALIIGNRNIEHENMPKQNTFANKFSNFWFTVQTGIRLPDTQTGMRIYPVRHLHGLRLLTSRYESELELLVYAAWANEQIIPVPIRVYYPPEGERVSHFRPIIDFARISVLNTVLCVLAVAYGLPLKIGRALMKYLRTCYSLLLFHILSMLVITPACWLYLKLGKMTEQKRYHLHQILQQSARFIMLRHGIPGSTFSYKVAPDADFDRPHIIICNHQSLIDLMCILIFTPKIIFLTKDWVWRNSTYGFLIRNAEYYPVSEGIEALLPKLRSVVERGYSIAVFPEGTRSKDCRIGHFHQGAFWLSEKLGLDILPMCLYGPGKVLPKNTYMLHKSPIYIQVDSPVSRAELVLKGKLKYQTSAMRKRYLKEYEDIANQIEQNV